MKFINTPYDGIEYLEIPITSATQFKYFFPIVERLDKKIIRRIDLIYYPSQVTVNNRSIVSDTVLANAYITIRPRNKTTVYQYPLFYLLNYWITNSSFTSELFNYPIQWDISFIEFPPSTTLTPGQSLLFAVYYQENSVQKIISYLGKKYIINPLLNLFLGTEKLFTLNIQVKIDNTNKIQFNFPNDERLERANIKKIAFYPGSISPNFKTLINSLSLYLKAFLTLRDYDGNEIVKDLCLGCLVHDGARNERTEIFLNNLKIDFPKSYVKFANNTSLVANTELLFTIFYNERTK